MKNRISVLFFGLFGILNVLYSQATDSLLVELDKYVQNREYYITLKEQKIDHLRTLLENEKDINTRYEINNQIFEEYSTYRYDSAMLYVNRNNVIAMNLNNSKLKDEVSMHEAILLATTGMYRESIDIFDTIDINRMDSILLYEYYSIGEWIYYAAAEYSGQNSRFRNYYQQKEVQYRDRLLDILSPESVEYSYYLGKKYLYEGNLVQAKKILVSVLQNMKVDSRIYAQTTFYIAEIYKLEENRKMYQFYLTLAAISDQVNPLKENQAMQDLALFLYSTNLDEIGRAYKYIQCAMEDAQFYNNRLRMVQIARKLPVIVKAYQIKSDNEKHTMRYMLIGITVLFILVIIALFYIWYQFKLVKLNRKKIVSINVSLEELNKKLAKANYVKEEYIGLFLDLSSSYLDKIDTYRETISRKIKANQINDLLNMVSSSKMMDDELKDFFHKFDIAFLNLFPTFIDDTNTLLKEDKSLKPRKDSLMNTELRIFALIRLGINDSSRIASFLRYTPQTIYNYRAKVKANANNRTDFESQIRDIGAL